MKKWELREKIDELETLLLEKNELIESISEQLGMLNKEKINGSFPCPLEHAEYVDTIASDSIDRDTVKDLRYANKMFREGMKGFEKERFAWQTREQDLNRQIYMLKQEIKSLGATLILRDLDV